MRKAIIAVSAASVLALSGTAFAQSTTVITQDPPAVVTQPAGPGGPVVIDRTGPDPSATTGSVTPPGCASTVTRQENMDGTATTVRQERCNRD